MNSRDAKYYTFRTGDVLGEAVEGVDLYSIDLIHMVPQADGRVQYRHLELMRTQGGDGQAYLVDAVPKFNRMLDDVGPDRTERAARTWGRLHGAEIQPWRDVAFDDQRGIHRVETDIT